MAENTFDRFSVFFTGDTVFLDGTVFPLGQLTTDVLNLDGEILTEIDRRVNHFMSTVYGLLQEKTDSAARSAQERLNAVWDLVFDLPVYQSLHLDTEAARNLFPDLLSDRANWSEVLDVDSEGHRMFEDFLSGLEYLAESLRNFRYFEFLRVDWQRRLAHSAQSGYLDVRETFSEEEVSGLTEGIAVRQQQIQKLFASVLDMDVPPQKNPCLITLTQTTKPIIEFPFHTLSFAFEQAEDGEYVEVMCPRNFYDLIDYHLRECLKRKVRMRACKNCRKYFAVMKNAKAEYCNHPFDAKGRSCREIASIIQWNQNRADDEVFKVYRREYKKRFARMKAGTMGEAQFYLWSKQAREKKAECEAGEITLTEFSEWLNQM